MCSKYTKQGTVEHLLSMLKRDLVCDKRDLVCVKRDLVCVKQGTVENLLVVVVLCYKVERIYSGKCQGAQVTSEIYFLLVLI